MNKYKLKIIISLFSALMVFIYTQDFKICLVGFGITFLLTLIYDGSKRYMRAFWSVLSILIPTNVLFFRFIGDVFGVSFEIGNEVINIYQSTGLIILCIVLLVLDFLERNQVKRIEKEPTTKPSISQTHYGTGDNVAGDKTITKK